MKSSEPQNEKVYCDCCKYDTILIHGDYEICTICYWEDDLLQLQDKDYEGGANPMSLRQAQLNFFEFGACDKDKLTNVRLPINGEQRDEMWKPFGR